MLKVVFPMLAIAIDDLEVQLSNSNLPVGKSAICFKPLAQKRDFGK